MRIGISLPEPEGTQALELLHDHLAAVADDGFASVWMANIFGLDALTALAVAGQGIGDIEIGPAVVPTYPRHAAALAQQALTTDLALHGHLTLGIGLSHKIVIEDIYGYDFDAPAGHMSEYLSILLPLLNGEQAAFTGKTMRAAIGLSTPRARPDRQVPVLVAAMGPQMLKLAGSQADGTILWMTGPATVRDHVIPAITAAATAAGKDSPRVVCILPVCVTSDEAAARASAAEEFAIYGQLPSYRAMLDKEGAAGPADVSVIGDEDEVTAQINLTRPAGSPAPGASSAQPPANGSPKITIPPIDSSK